MATREWLVAYSQALNNSQLTQAQIVKCRETMRSLGEMQDKIQTAVVDGDFQVTLTSEASKLANDTKWVSDSFVKNGIPEITIDTDKAKGFSTIVVRARDTSGQTVDNTVPKDTYVPAATNPTTNIATNMSSVESATKAPSDANTKSTSASEVELATQPSENARSKVKQDEPNTSEFFIDVEVYLEGVQIPHSSATVSYGLGSPPSCTIILPATSLIRDLPETTKVHIFFKDLLPDESGTYQWRLLFDGEMSGFQYNIDPNGATMSISALHSSAYISLMQLMSLDAAEYIFDSNPRLIGDATMTTVFGQNKVSTKLIDSIMKGKGYKSMADIVYQLMRAVLEGTQDSAVGKYYHDKLSNDKDAWKLLKRIYGVSKAVAESPVPTYDKQYNNGTTSSGAGKDGGIMPSNGSSKIADAALYYVDITGRDGTVDGISNFQCDGLVTASLRRAGVEPTGWPEHWVPDQQQYFINRGWYSTNPSDVQPGDVIIMNCYDEADHTGIFMRDANGVGYLVHNSASKRQTIQTKWEPPGWDRFAYVGHGRIPAVSNNVG